MMEWTPVERCSVARRASNAPIETIYFAVPLLSCKQGTERVSRGLTAHVRGTQDNVAHIRRIRSIGITFALQADAGMTRIRGSGLAANRSVETDSGVKLKGGVCG